MVRARCGNCFHIKYTSTHQIKNRIQELNFKQEVSKFINGYLQIIECLLLFI